MLDFKCLPSELPQIIFSYFFAKKNFSDFEAKKEEKITKEARKEHEAVKTTKKT